ncbi:MAG TPA: YbaK/EbsC family protein [Patescibacteria group bacterium]|nr:YbaK/EbsC family protein [Patescibacteria group bacterium]
MIFGKLQTKPATELLPLLAKPTAEVIVRLQNESIRAVEIDPTFSDTASFCEAYEIPTTNCANCVVLEASRGDKVWYAACMVLAKNRADVNGAVRRFLDARKVSFAPMEKALELTGMEYGGITPVGLPSSWQILIDPGIPALEWVIIGAGLRKAKLVVPGAFLPVLPNVHVLENMCK